MMWSGCRVWRHGVMCGKMVLLLKNVECEECVKCGMVSMAYGGV